MKKFLIINPFGIGDVLFTTPAIDNLKENFPGCFIAYICNNRTFELLETNPNINRIFNFDKEDYKKEFKRHPFYSAKFLLNLLGSIKKNKFDAAVDFSLGPIYSFFLKLLGVPKRIGFNYKNRGRFLTDKVEIDGFKNKHIVEYYLGLLEPLSAGAKKKDLRIFLTEEDKGFADEFLEKNNIDISELLIGIVPCGGASWGLDADYKQWRNENFAKLADALLDKYNAKIIIFGSREETGLCNGVISAMKNRPVNACGKTTLRQFAALLAKCKLIICNDGGPLHMAVAVGAKTISIFGPVDEKVYGPYPLNDKHFVITAQTSCRPCYRNFKIPRCNNKKCLIDIKPEQILKIIDEKLRRG